MTTWDLCRYVKNAQPRSLMRKPAARSSERCSRTVSLVAKVPETVWSVKLCGGYAARESGALALTFSFNSISLRVSSDSM